MTTRRERAKSQKPQLRSTQGDASLAKNKQQEAIIVADEKPESERSVAFEAGKFCLDIAKLVFGGVILAGIMQQNIDFNPLFVTGLGVVIIFVAFGFYLIKKSAHKK